MPRHLSPDHSLTASFRLRSLIRSRYRLRCAPHGSLRRDASVGLTLPPRDRTHEASAPVGARLVRLGQVEHRLDVEVGEQVSELRAVEELVEVARGSSASAS